jgi:hypothetical protein
MALSPLLKQHRNLKSTITVNAPHMTIQILPIAENVNAQLQAGFLYNPG